LIHEVVHIIHIYLLHREVIKLDREEQNFGRSTRTLAVGRLQVEILYSQMLDYRITMLVFIWLAMALCANGQLYTVKFHSVCKSFGSVDRFAIL
jgi:hypothetical protein